MQINSGKIQINWEKLEKIGTGSEKNKLTVALLL